MAENGKTIVILTVPEKPTEETRCCRGNADVGDRETGKLKKGVLGEVAMEVECKALELDKQGVDSEGEVVLVIGTSGDARKEGNHISKRDGEME